IVSDPVTDANTDRSSKKKKKKKSRDYHHPHQQQQQQQHQQQNRIQNQEIRWKSEAQQQFYSSKLIQALSHVRDCTVPRRGRAVREAANTALAVAAKGRSRWSRAILTNRLKLKFRKQHKKQRVTSSASVSAVVTGSSRSRKPRVSLLALRGKTLPAVQRKVRVLGRLVPGCRKQPLPVILEEATDYIPALEMQIRAMSALVQLFSGSTSGAAVASSSTARP
ncbi:hypothetical protein CFOL_v3_15189, partial [Cephalotus follicularis]